jgi:hypothetical protein
VLSLFTDPELDFDRSGVRVDGGTQNVRYTYADVSMIEVPPSKEIVLDDPEIQFTLTGESLQAVQRALGVLSQPEIAVVGEDGKVYLATSDSKNPTSDQYKIEVGTTPHTFNMIFKSENIKLMNATYDVRIQSKGVGHFKAEDIEYWIVAEASSEFTKGS